MSQTQFIIKPSGGWIHPDGVISKQGASYIVKYVGCLEVKVSMKTLDFKTRSSVAKECINRVCEAAGLKPVDKKRKLNKKIQKSITDTPNMSNSGSNVNLNISSSNLTLTSLDNNQIIASHDMPRISFASGGDYDSLDFVGFIAKDHMEWRACYVLECGGGLAKDVIATMGQAFELRFKQYMKPNQMAIAIGHPSTSTGGDADKDYYNDLPGKVPPDVQPPPVPPLPAVVPPFTTLPPVQSPNLIDLLADFHDAPHHNYVNDLSAMNQSNWDIFDMQPFTQPNFPTTHEDPIVLTEEEQLAQLEKEIWFHGQISRTEAERLLQKDGDFLVRESPNSEGRFVLSGMQDNTKKHLLLIDPEKVVRTKDRKFDSVNHLIKFHCDNALPIISSQSALVLRTPIHRNQTN